MGFLIQSIYPWNSLKKAMEKRNPGLGNTITITVVFAYFLIFIFTIAGKLYPILRDTDLNFLGAKSNLVRALGYLVYNWGVSIAFFFLALIIVIIPSVLITRTGIKSFRTYVEFVKIDSKELRKGEIIQTIFKDLSIIAGFSIVIFVILELLTLAGCSLVITFVLPIIYNINEKSLAFVFLALLIAHIIFFPLFTFLYNRLVNKKLTHTDTLDVKEFMTDDGEIDMEKWKSRTWGKKPYTFNWEEEDVFPITCFACGSIISSDLLECPICDADLIKEIEEIDTDYPVEEEEVEEDTEEDDSTASDKDEVSI